MPPADVRGRLAADDQPLVGVRPLVGDRGDLLRVPEHAGDERLAGVGELVRVVGVVEGVAVALEQREVGVHRRPGWSVNGLGMNDALHALGDRDLLDHVPERHDVVGHGQGVGVAQVDLLLPGAALVVAELHRDAHRLQRLDRVAPEVRGDVVAGLVEVPAGVRRHRRGAVGSEVAQQVELDLGVDVAGEAGLGGLGQRAAQHVPGVGPRRRAVGHGDVAEHPGRVVVAGLGGPGQHLERRRVGAGDHVRLVDAGEALDGRAVEPDALGEGPFELRGRHRHGLEVAEHVGEPQPHEADVAFLERAQHELLLAVHGRRA